MNEVVVAPLLVALVTAVLALGTRWWTRVQQAVSLLGAVGYLVAVGALVAAVQSQGILVYELSGWDAPFGIVLVADALSAVFLALGAVVSLCALAFSLRYVDTAGQRLSYHPLYHFMVVGVTGSFLTGDVFNLFVWFEVMLMSTYVLVVFYSGPEHTRAALFYAFLNLLGGAIMLVAIGGLYATTGTLNMADMAGKLASPEASGVALAPVLGLSGVLFAVFALKAGIVPFQFWVPDAYRAAPAPVTAMLAGVVKKVGVYAIVRLYFTVFAAAEFAAPLTAFGGQSFLDFYGPILFVMALGSIALGGLGAVGREDLDGLLAYSSIGQIGFIVLPLAVAAAVAPAQGEPLGESLRALGVAAAVVYSVNHGLAKSLLFLVSGTVQEAVGTVRFADLGGISERDPVLAGSFFVGGLALVGIPPLVGFFGKFMVFDVAVRATDAAALAVALVGAILTIAYVSLAWARAFWGEPTEAVTVAHTDRALVAATVVLALAVVAFGVGFEPLYRLALDAGGAAIDTQGYVDAVLAAGNGGGAA